MKILLPKPTAGGEIRHHLPGLSSTCRINGPGLLMAVLTFTNNSATISNNNAVVIATSARIERAKITRLVRGAAMMMMLIG